MAYVRCDIDDGLRPSEATVEVKDVHGRSQFLRVERDFVKSFDGVSYLPMGIVHRDNEVVLIELPHEADSGANRLWVPKSSVRETPSRNTVAVA